ncbi:ATP-grasp domain-containing protein [Bradyrhizobium oligotrophicum]|uniref:ATP-grasp domain-containing protein n=1 Tax=Bradyrhizobium oligotrophicum TaxID=44255 RepID=UPI003EBD35F3
MAGKKVLLLAEPDDDHGIIIREVLTRRFGAASAFWSLTAFPDQNDMSVKLGSGLPMTILSVDGEYHRLDAFHVAWLRRPGSVQPRHVSREMRRFCAAESSAHIWGGLAAARIPIVNDPDCEYAANHKALQLRVAQEIGFRIPKTLMTADPNSAKEFIDSLGAACIYKGFTQGIGRAVATREFGLEDIEALGSIVLSPVILQEKIPKGRDIRVNVFGRSVFAAYTVSESPAAELDWRVDTGAEWWPMKLPDDTAEGLCNVLDRLLLDYGCFDLRETPTGEFVFFEVNPSGQFLWLEIWTGQPLAEAFCALLLDEERRRGARRSFPS